MNAGEGLSAPSRYYLLRVLIEATILFTLQRWMLARMQGMWDDARDYDTKYGFVICDVSNLTCLLDSRDMP